MSGADRGRDSLGPSGVDQGEDHQDESGGGHDLGEQVRQAARWVWLSSTGGAATMRFGQHRAADTPGVAGGSVDRRVSVARPTGGGL